MSIIHALSANSGRLVRLTFGPESRGRPSVQTKGHAKLAKTRIVMLSGGLIMIYVVIFARLINFGMGPRDDTSSIPAEHVTAARPDIVDRNGELLATDIRTVSMFAEPNRVVDPDEAVEKIAEVFPDIDRKSLYKKLADRRSHFAWLRRQLTPKQQSEILALGIPAIGFRPEIKRFYPGGRTAAHILGYVDIDNHGVAGGVREGVEHHKAVFCAMDDQRFFVVFSLQKAAEKAVAGGSCAGNVGVSPGRKQVVHGPSKDTRKD